MNVSRLVLGVFAIGIAAAFYVTALGYPDKAANMPLIYSVVVALLGVAMVMVVVCMHACVCVCIR
jgi:4-amino-4-deoxy-L-arabinose transferase-like glycosyltransferase